MIKLTYKDPKKNDSVETKIKKMNELNYNIKLLYMIRETIQMANVLFHRHSCPVLGPMSHKDALSFSQMLEKAYKL